MGRRAQIATVAILKESMMGDGESEDDASKREEGDEGRGEKENNKLLLSSFFSLL